MSRVVGRLIAVAHEAHNGLHGVVGVDPFEALLGIGVLPQSALLGVEVVECLDKALLSAVGGVEVFGEEPLDGLVVAPFDLLPISSPMKESLAPGWVI